MIEKIKNRKLGAISLALISISAMFSVRNFPSIALQGYQAIFFLGIATLFFFFPLALVCAELSSKFPKQGGLYVWVSAGLGKRAGFVASWLEWINNVFYFLAVLVFMSTTISYLFSYNFSKLGMLGLMLGIFWLVTIFNFIDLKY